MSRSWCVGRYRKHTVRSKTFPVQAVRSARAFGIDFAAPTWPAIVSRVEPTKATYLVRKRQYRTSLRKRVGV
eukprot:906033-Rhodomonas_salina.4